MVLARKITRVPCPEQGSGHGVWAVWSPAREQVIREGTWRGRTRLNG
jgi:hypothetical protein